MLSNKVYDVLKWITMIAIPATATLCLTLAGIWGWPYGEQIVGSLTAINTCIGVLLGISTTQYNKSNKSDESDESAE